MEIRTPNRLPFHRWAVFPVLLAQFVVLLLATLVLWQWKGAVSGYSGLCGGLIAGYPMCISHGRLFASAGPGRHKPSSSRSTLARQAR